MVPLISWAAHWGTLIETRTDWGAAFYSLFELLVFLLAHAVVDSRLLDFIRDDVAQVDILIVWCWWFFPN